MIRAISTLSLLLGAAACNQRSAVRQATPAQLPASPDSVVAQSTPRPVADAVAARSSSGRLLPSMFSRQHVFLRGTVGGAPALLLFDSGASATILSPRLVRRLGLAYRGRYTAFGIGEPVTGASVYDGTPIQVGSLQIRPATVLSWSDARFPTYGVTQPDGVIGHDLLVESVVTIDAANGRVMSYDTASAPRRRPGVHEIPLRVTHGLPVVQVDVFAAGQPSFVSTIASVPVVIDFGAGAGVQLTRDASRRLGFPARLRDTRPRQLVGIGGVVELPEGIADSLRIAGATIPHVVVATDTAETASVALAEAEGFIGTEVLRRFAVTLDYARKRALFEPNASLRAPFCRNAAGLCVRTESALRGVEVVHVDPGSPAARAGIRPRYVILGIDGTSVAQLSVSEIDRLLDRSNGAVLEIVRGTAQLRAIARPEPPAQRRRATRPPPRERLSEFVRLPAP